ncbi:zinc finger protein 112 [Trichonephila clavipes]|nr:zinc finger protein 112 [Trichonephila clavipes]
MAFTQGNSRHDLHVQDNEKLYVCKMCNKGFSQNSHLKDHLRTHTKEKPYVCEVCNKGLSRSDHLKAHLRTHTNEKPYVCEMCYKGFSQSNDLKVHLRTHTMEKPYVCEMCNKAFSQGLGTGIAYVIALGHDRTAVASQCNPFAWYLCAAESKNAATVLAISEAYNLGFTFIECNIKQHSRVDTADGQSELGLDVKI